MWISDDQNTLYTHMRLLKYKIFRDRETVEREETRTEEKSVRERRKKQ